LYYRKLLIAAIPRSRFCGAAHCTQVLVRGIRLSLALRTQEWAAVFGYRPGSAQDENWHNNETPIVFSGSISLATAALSREF
jgi:hypothetical protein